ncbi:hypothetical protein PFTANZ_01595 [Plasmodium falciparum Tanzania (2000708)]|uniref:Uncharacterized protein n=1 Tax=Plasmodium falciparum Tanzania (2000708) TaxID=1036725 RepID=A0A024WAD6_PLAFA|nr:hypothetical protein PFTANZ_01595 [Plasmodium falciparum Tanzania (2000708)]
MNSKTLEILNLMDEKSFKKCEKLINVGLKSKKNERIYLLLKCLLHSYLNEIKECKSILNNIDSDELDENMFYILVNIYSNINEEVKLIDIYEDILKKVDVNKNNNNNLKCVNKQKLDSERILKNLFDYCLNNCFYKRGNQICLKLYKSTNDSKYLLYNSLLLYMNNADNNMNVYNLCLNFLKNYQCLNTDKVIENFSFFLILYFLNIKRRKFQECLDINEYAYKNDYLLHPLQYNIYKLYTYLIFNKLDKCIDIVTYLIKQIPENTDYYILYMDILIHLLNKQDEKIIHHLAYQKNENNIFHNYKKNYLMYIEFCKKCFINTYIKNKTSKKFIPRDLSDFWKSIIQTQNDTTYYNNNMNSNNNNNNMSNNHISNNNMDDNNYDHINNNNHDHNYHYFMDNVIQEIIKDILSIYKNVQNKILNNQYKEIYNQNIQHNVWEFLDIINMLDSNIKNYKEDISLIYRNINTIKPFLYFLFIFILKECENYQLLYYIKNYISFLNDDMVSILIIFITCIRNIIYSLIEDALENIKSAKDNNNTLTQSPKETEEIKYKKRKILNYYKQIYNFEKLLYILYKKDVHKSFNKLLSLYYEVTNVIIITDDNMVTLLVEMALYLDKCNICKIKNELNINKNINCMLSKFCDINGIKMEINEYKSVQDFLNLIDYSNKGIYSNNVNNVNNINSVNNINNVNNINSE